MKEIFTGTMNNTESVELPDPAVQKPKSHSTNERKTRYSIRKENAVETKKTTQEPRKSGREPLKVLNTKVRTPKKSISSSVEKSAPKRSTRSDLSPTQPKLGKKEKVSLPKIIVYEDPSDGVKVQEKGNRRKTMSALSKSWDGSVTRSRRSNPESAESPKLAVSQGRNVRGSLNDLRPTSKKEKTSISTAEGKKSLDNGKPRTPKMKPEQAEFKEMLTKLEILFPNVDPEYIKAQFIKFKNSLSDLVEFLTSKGETSELPTRANYERKLEVERLQNKFFENFSVEGFLEIIPDPWEYFLKTEKHNCIKYSSHSLHYLKNKYKRHYMQAIQETLEKNKYSLYLTDKELKKKNRLLKMRTTNRSKSECDAKKPSIFNVQFIHEVAFIENEKEIKLHIKKVAKARYKKFIEAQQGGTLLECKSCNDFSLLQDDVVNCPANHVFCKDCFVKYAEIEKEKDKIQFKCLVKCEEKLSLEYLQGVLSPPVIAKTIQRNQLEGIKSSAINDLVYCPFCYYVAMIPSELSVLKCPNPNCLLESCRHCKNLNHEPLKCNDLEKFDEKSLIVELEEEEGKEENDPHLTCTHCGGEFLKKEDSNQMVCSCGATMCSICQQPLRDCEHFNSKTGNESLSSSDDETEVAEDDVEGSPDFSENRLGMLLSESEAF